VLGLLLRASGTNSVVYSQLIRLLIRLLQLRSSKVIGDEEWAEFTCLHKVEEYCYKSVVEGMSRLIEKIIPIGLNQAYIEQLMNAVCILLLD